MNHTPTTPRIAQTRRPAGFTLLEMLVAAALCSVLLLALWTLYSTFANLFDRGQARVERSQLSRALMQQIADDLQSAIQDPIAAAPDQNSGEAQRRRFGLAGSSHELRVDVLQVTPRQGNRMPVGSATGEVAGVTEARVPELRTIYYSFTPPTARDVIEPDAESAGGPAGLIRRELDFETPAREVDEFDVSGAAPPSAAADRGSASATGAGPGYVDPAPSAVDDSWTWVPEVLSLEFRYFDGNGWSSSWNSLQRKSLPVAVEVRIALADPGPSVASMAASQGPSCLPQIAQADSDSAVTAEATPIDSTVEEAAPSSVAATHLQMIIDLPASAEYRKSRVVETSRRRVPAAVPVRRIAPRRWTSPAKTTTLPEDWIRTRSP